MDDYEDNSKAAYEIFVNDLKERTDGYVDCRYAVFDFKVTSCCISNMVFFKYTLEHLFVCLIVQLKKFMSQSLLNYSFVVHARAPVNRKWTR